MGNFENIDISCIKPFTLSEQTYRNTLQSKKYIFCFEFWVWKDMWLGIIQLSDQHNILYVNFINHLNEK